MPRFFCYYFFLSNTTFLSWKSCFIAHIKWDVIISSSLRLLLNVWIWYRCQDRIENCYHHDGEQLGFYKNTNPYENTEQNEGCSFNFILQVKETKNKKRRILIYLTKTLLERTSNAISVQRKLTWMSSNRTGKLQATEAATGGLLQENLFLDILQNSQENTYARVSFLITLLKKRLWHGCFPLNFAKFLGTLFV